MSTTSRLRFALPLAALLAGACVPQLRQRPGSDMVNRSRGGRVQITHSSSSCTGQKGVTVASPVGAGPVVAAVGNGGGACTTARGDTIPDPSHDRSQPARPTP